MPRNFNFHHTIVSSMSYNRAIMCLKNAFEIPDGSFLIYAALELRICIERLLFEYLIIMNIPDERISTYMNLYRVKDLAKAIYKSEPEFDKKLEYTSFYLDTIGLFIKIPIPDIQYLNISYGRLGNYLHNFKKPENSTNNENWWNSLINFLEEVRSHLEKYFQVPRAYFKMNEKGLELYQHYKNDTMPKDKIRQEILKDWKTKK